MMININNRIYDVFNAEGNVEVEEWPTAEEIGLDGSKPVRAVMTIAYKEELSFLDLPTETIYDLIRCCYDIEPGMIQQVSEQLRVDKDLDHILVCFTVENI